MAARDACDTCEPAAEPTCEPASGSLDLTPLLDALREIDAAAELVPNDTPRFCNGLVVRWKCLPFPVSEYARGQAAVGGAEPWPRVQPGVLRGLRRPRRACL